ncbi:integral membrane protein [Zymoseptoria brevis]|uniref:Integral membrane protein n=1 Tax=Zymoseptoria brevis TaxID=1047168 RepID=A0A0F4G6K1_9PEZI|nr:integral membrane protein [Zymoseptoria brevis]
MASHAAEALLRHHPLQRLESPSRGVSAAFHLAGLASFAYSFSFLVRNPNPINDSYGWHMQYLTIIGLLLATLTFAAGLLADVTLSRRLFRIKNALSVASAPLEVLISILYWGLRVINPALVEPEWAAPLALMDDMSFHGAPSSLLVLDLLLFSPPYAIAFLPAFGLSAVIAFGYWFWIERCYQFNKFYPYPIFELLDTPGRIGLFAFSAVLMTASTTLLVWLYGVVNGQEKRGAVQGDVHEGRSGNVKGQ